jgi:hypothetical protein
MCTGDLQVLSCLFYLQNVSLQDNMDNFKIYLIDENQAY